MEHSIYKFILRYSLRQQVVLTLMAAASFPFLYMFYELPKMIVNEAIQGRGADFPVEFAGLEFDQIEYLYLLCGVFLALVFINQGFKYAVNVYRGLTGERMLRRLRFQLYSRVLRFPLPTFRKVSQGEIIPMITAEVEPLGGFIGDAFSLPAFQGGTLLVILGFLLVQNPVMALAAVALYPLQAYLIPKLQRKVNLLGKERVKLVRRLSDRIGETVQGVQEVHVNNTSRLLLADFSTRLGGIFDIRYQIYLKKFLIKFLNNFIQQLGPFFFYSIGGYLVIQGRLEVGTLIAAIAAHKDMAAPWKELLSYYQQREDARIKYEQVIEQFEPPGMPDEEELYAELEEVPHLTGPLEVKNLRLRDEQDRVVLDGLNLTLPLDKRIAVVGEAGSGREEFLLLLARQLAPDAGGIRAGGVDLLAAPESLTGRRLAYVGQSGFVFNSTLGNNLFFGLRHKPVIDPAYGPDEVRQRRDFVREAMMTGNASDDMAADWIDYEAAGVEDRDSLIKAGLEALRRVGLADDIYRLGLRSRLDPSDNTGLAEGVLEARCRLYRRVEADEGVRGLIEAFDSDKFNANATLAENLLFGSPVGDVFGINRLAENDYVLKVLEKADLTVTMLDIGYQLADLMVEIFADLPPDHEFFQLYSFIEAEDLPEYQALLGRVKREQLRDLQGEDRTRLMALPFQAIPGRHRIGLITDEVRESVVRARKIFARDLPDGLKDSIAFFDRDSFNAAGSIQDNILFGKVVYGQAQAEEKVGALVGEVVEEAGLHQRIAAVGLNYEVGINGARLSLAQRQKLVIARSLMKRPDLLLLSEATAVLDSPAQQQILENLLDLFEGRGLIWSLHRVDQAAFFDHVLVMQDGRLVEQGGFQQLAEGAGPLSRMLAQS